MSGLKEREQQAVSKLSIRVWLRLLKANSTIEQTIRRHLREKHQTTLPRFDVMSALARFPDGLKMSELSSVLRVSNGNVTGIVDRLVEDGIAFREMIPHDKRALKVKLTANGLATFNVQAAQHEQWVAGLLSSLGDEKLMQLSDLLKDANEHLERNERPDDDQ